MHNHRIGAAGSLRRREEKPAVQNRALIDCSVDGRDTFALPTCPARQQDDQEPEEKSRGGQRCAVS